MREVEASGIDLALWERLLRSWFAFLFTIIYNYVLAERKEEQHADGRCCPLRFEVFDISLSMDSGEERRTVTFQVQWMPSFR